MEAREHHDKQKPIAVLLVEDEVTFIKVVQYHLQKFQGREFRLTWKETVDGALEELRKNPSYDIILTDYSLPASNGLEFCLQLNEMGSQIPMVILTATRDFKLAVDAMKLGVEDFLLKEELTGPHLPRTLLNVIERSSLRKNMQAVEKRMSIAENRARAIRELVVSVCHEFNNPLAAMKISSDLIQRQPLGTEEKIVMHQFDDYLQKVEDAIKRLRDGTFEKINYHSHDFKKKLADDGMNQ